MSKESTGTSGGVMGLGWLVALVLSYWVNHSIGWAILHACLSWLYVAYWLCVHGLGGK